VQIYILFQIYIIIPSIIFIW